MVYNKATGKNEYTSPKVNISDLQTNDVLTSSANDKLMGEDKAWDNLMTGTQS